MRNLSRKETTELRN